MQTLIFLNRRRVKKSIQNIVFNIRLFDTHKHDFIFTIVDEKNIDNKKYSILIICFWSKITQYWQKIKQKNENKTTKISCYDKLKTQYKQNIHVESIHEKKFEKSLHAIFLLHANFHRM